MIEITERPLSDSEKKILLSRIPSSDTRAENAVMAFIFILFVFLGPLLLVDRYWFDIPSKIQLIALVPIVIITSYLTYRLDKEGFDSKYIMSDIEAGLVTIYDVKTDRIIERKDPDDLGPSYYIDLGQKGEYKTLFLFGQYLMNFRKSKFPCTEFQVIKGKGGQVIELIPKGDYLKPIKKLKPYSKEDFKKGRVPDDGQLLAVSLDEIVE